ncbi:hypothetical protein LguiA_012079 [Lonicera macranthoides]
MVMDSHFTNFSDSTNGFEFDNEIVFPNFNQSPSLENGFNANDDSLDLSFLDLPSTPPDPDPGTLPPYTSADSPDDFSDTVLKFINQILVEEKMEEKPCMFHDPLALQEAEKSFYDVIGEKYPTPPDQPPVESPDDIFFGSSSEYSTNSSSSAGNPIDPQWVGDTQDFKSTVVNTRPSDYFSQSSFPSGSQWSSSSSNNLSNNVNGVMEPYASNHIMQNIFSDSDSILQFQRGMEEASKFLPTGNPLVIDLDKFSLPVESKENDQEVVVKVEKNESEESPDGSRGRRKHYHQFDSDFDEEERSSKQLAIYKDESELSEMFDKVLLCTDANGVPLGCSQEPPSEVQQNGQANGSKSRSKKQSDKSESVDLRTLLINCAQSVAADDQRTANEQLKLIRQHASPHGDASQRLAHIFANGLEARMAGTGTQIYAALSSKRISAAEKLKAYQVYLSCCPFKKISIFFANKMIMEMASSASTLHIIDFGIQYGFQWPILIHNLSNRPGGPPKLRITGIEHPQPGFRPAERIEETGRRLANYCERFNVPFEYNAIATQKWETIQIEDLKLKSNEFVAVNCLFRFENLLDETVVVNSPRDAVLNLIRKMNPNIFVHAIINGAYSAPFFVTRFREALFHYSAWFDVFEATLSHEDEHRLNLETEFYGRGVMNVIACEGVERVSRPETYKQWQVRSKRAGLKPMPLNQELVKKFRNKVKTGYHKDFVFDEDGPWMLQGWKGRILYASSCWVPS